MRAGQQMKAKNLYVAAVSALALVAGSAHAALQIAGTRIVFDGTQKEQTVRLNNTGDAPVLAQLWVDSGKDDVQGNVQAGAENTPFILNPPVTRINGGKSQVIRVFKTAETAALPADRESVFYFNALEVPARAKAAPGAKAADGEESANADKGENRLTIALRTRLKLFYRPAGIKADVIEAAQGLTWKGHRDGNDYVVTCTNGSPLHVSFARLVLKHGDAETPVQSAMASPKGETTFRFEGAAAGQGPLVLNYDYITDLGAFVPGTATLREEG